MGFLTPRWIETKQDLGLTLVTFRVVTASVPAAYAASTSATNKAALPEGWNHAQVQKASTGIYDFQLVNKSARNVAILGVAPATSARIAFAPLSTALAGTFTVRTTDTSGTLADADFFVTVALWKTNKVY